MTAYPPDTYCHHRVPMSVSCMDCGRKGDPPCPYCGTEFKGGAPSATEILGLAAHEERLYPIWRTERPTVPDHQQEWWWLWYPEGRFDPKVVLVTCNDIVWESGIDDGFDLAKRRYDGALWCGPIPVPAFPKAQP